MSRFRQDLRARWRRLVWLSSLLLTRSVGAAPSAKTKSWVNYWDDPAHVRQGLAVAGGVVAVAIVLFVIGKIQSGREEAARRKRRRRG